MLVFYSMAALKSVLFLPYRTFLGTTKYCSYFLQNISCPKGVSMIFVLHCVVPEFIHIATLTHHHHSHPIPVEESLFSAELYKRTLCSLLD